MRELNVTLIHLDKYGQKQQRPGSLAWRKETGVESEPDLFYTNKQGLLENHISFMQQQNILTKWDKTQS